MPKIVPRAKVWLELDGKYVFGHGLCSILDAVARHGSIKAAASGLGRSYRHVWSRIKEAERVLKCPLVRTRVGGSGSRRSDLTPLAVRLSRDFQSLRARTFDVVAREFAARHAATLEVARHKRS